ncbi:2-hydroxyacid dehydrogenase [Propylenella binzhouense]|nr:2-hydroxyacid dehydrogenase [Propylenella binzhouense]
MPDLIVGIIDTFHPKIIETIADSVPDGWVLSIADGGTPDARSRALADADVAFVMAAPLPTDLLRTAGRLGFIQKLGAGVDRIDLDYCRERGIGVARLHAGNNVPVAEHTLMLILAAYRRLPVLDRQTRAGNWDKEVSRGINRQITGKTIGIVGFGAIGRMLAQMLAGFDIRILYYDPIRAPADVETKLRAEYMDLDALVATADIVSLHLPLMKETAGIIDERRIAAMKPDALLVNAARGGLVDEDALARALARGHLFGAAIDAFSKEPPIGSPLLREERTVLTPHAAGATLDNFAAIAERAVGNTKRYLAGEDLPPADLVVAPGKRAAA